MGAYPALAIKPPASPLDEFTKITQLKSLMQGQLIQGEQLKGEQLDNEKRKMTIDQAHAMQSAYAAALDTDPDTGAKSFNPAKVQQGLVNAGHGELIPDVMTHLTTLQKDTEQVNELRDKHFTSKLDALGTFAAGFKASGYSPEFAGTQAAVLAGAGYGKEAQQLMDHLNSVPIDQRATEWPKLAETILAQSPKQRELQAQETQAAARMKSAGKGPQESVEEQRKEGFDAIVQKVTGAGFPTIDPKKLPGSLSAALKKGAITQDEYNQAAGYMSTNPTPATNLTVRVEGQQNANDLAIGKLFEGKDVRVPDPASPAGKVMSYHDALKAGFTHEQMTALQAPESQKLREKSDSAWTTNNSITRYQTHINQYAPTLSEDDRRALQVLTDTNKVAHSFFQKEASGVLDTLFGEPLTGYSTKAMGGIMTKDQYDKMSPGAKHLLADYFNVVIQNFANMKQVLGSIGRNEIQLQAEIHTIPLPYLDKDSADPLFKDKMEDLAGRNQSIPSFGQKAPEPRPETKVTSPQKGKGVSLKVGDTFYQNGHTYIADEVDANGKPTKAH